MTRPSAMVSLDDTTLDPNFNMILYGYPGIGKSPLVGTGHESVFFMDSDNGLDSARASGSRSKAAPCHDYDDLSTLMEWLKHDQPKEDPAIKTVCWDSLTLFQDRALIDELLVDAHAENPKQSEDVASQREYLVNMNRIGRYVRELSALPLNVIITCHVMTDTEHASGELIFMPAITGKKSKQSFASYVCGYMNIIAYYGLNEANERVLITETSNHYFARDRFHALRTQVRDSSGALVTRGYVKNPTMPKIEALIQGARDKRAEQKQGTSTPRRRRRPEQ